MKYKWKRYWVWICLLIVLFGILAYLKINSSISIEIFGGGAITLLTLFVSIISHYQEGDKFFKGLFTEFNMRYDEMNSFLNQISNDTKLDDVGKQKVIDYLNLCAEEYMWVKEEEFLSIYGRVGKWG